MIELIGLAILAVVVLFFVLPIIVGVGMLLLGVVGIPLAALARFINKG